MLIKLNCLYLKTFIPIFETGNCISRMAKEKKQPKQNATGKKEISIPQKENPLTRFGWLWISILVLAVYLPTLNLGFTELDDSIFIKETSSYNKNISHLITSFKRGVFNETDDVYYRPLLLNSFVLNYQMSGEDIKGYHIVNLLLHLISVLLLFVLLKKLKVNKISALLLSLIFAVHPVLTQAVAWIPGRNDTLLAVFVFSYLIACIKYSEDHKFNWLFVQVMMLLAALFTKETAVFAAPVAWLLCVYVPKQKWFSVHAITMYMTWLLGGLFWVYVRSQATLKNEQLNWTDVITSLPHRLPVLISYLGKIFLPLNLSVFPIMKDTTLIYGFISILLIAVIIFFSPEKNWRVIIAGIGIYILFLIPALLVPSNLNDQDFEHRLYLPIVGILLVVSESVLLKNSLKQIQIVFAALAIVLVFAFMNHNRQKFFNDPITFWTEAMRTSPHSGYATMMLGARIDKTDKVRAAELVRKAYQMDSTQKYINYYMGVLMQTQDSILQSEKYFQAEIKISDYFMCYFHMARVAFEKKDKPAAIHYLETYLDRNMEDAQANNNLLLLYIETGQKEKARALLDRMRQLGLQVPDGIDAQLR